MEPGPAAPGCGGCGAPTAAGTGPDLPVRHLGPAQEPLITRLLFAGAQVACAGLSQNQGRECSLPLLAGQRSRLEPSRVRSRPAFQFHQPLSKPSCRSFKPSLLPICPQVPAETDLAQQETEGGVFPSAQCSIVLGGGSCGRALAHLTCLQMSPSVNSSQLSGTRCLSSTMLGSAD